MELRRIRCNYRVIWFLALTAMTVAARADTQTFRARILQIRDNVVTLDSPTGVIQVAADAKSWIWYDRKRATLGVMPTGQTVAVKIQTAAAGPVLREIADAVTKDWLDAIRREFRPGVVTALDSRTLSVQFSDGARFTYRATEKSDVTVNGQSMPYTSLKVGQSLAFRGRLLATGDTWLYAATDRPPVPTTTAKPDRPSPDPVPATMPSAGTAVGVVSLIMREMGKFDLRIDGRHYHFQFGPDTKFTVNGRKADATALQLDLEIKVAYRRDRLGRLIVSRVQIP